MELLEIRDLKVGFDNTIVLKKVKLRVFLGEKIIITGPTGSGKTTLLETVLGFVKPLSGEIFFRGRKLKDKKDFELLRRFTGYVFQNPDDQLFCPTVFDEVAFGPMSLGLSGNALKRMVEKILSLFGALHLKEKPPFLLSGGEKRIVSICAALSTDPVMLLLDEPTAGLDKEKEKVLVDFLKKTDKTVILVTHSLGLLKELGWPIYRLENGVVLRAN